MFSRQSQLVDVQLNGIGKIDFALACEYISTEQHKDLSNQGIEIDKLINYMINNPGKFGVKEE